MFRTSIAVSVLLAGTALADSHDGMEVADMTCAEFRELGIEEQKAAVAEMAETGGEEGEVPPESALAGEERVTALVAACAEAPDATLADTDAGLDGDE